MGCVRTASWLSQGCAQTLALAKGHCQQCKSCAVRTGQCVGDRVQCRVLTARRRLDVANAAAILIIRFRASYGKWMVWPGASLDFREKNRKTSSNLVNLWCTSRPFFCEERIAAPYFSIAFLVGQAMKCSLFSFISSVSPQCNRSLVEQRRWLSDRALRFNYPFTVC